MQDFEANFEYRDHREHLSQIKCRSQVQCSLVEAGQFEVPKPVCFQNLVTLRQ